MSFINKILWLFKNKKTWKSIATCYKCWNIIKWMTEECWIWRKKCTKCWVTNYRVTVYTWDHNVKKRILWDKNFYKQEKKKRKEYYDTIYPLNKLKKEYWEERVNQLTKSRPNDAPKEIELELLKLKILGIKDNVKELWQIQFQIVQRKIELKQYRTGVIELAKLLYYDQFDIYNEQMVNEVHFWKPHTILLWNVDSIINNSFLNYNRILNEFKKEWYSKLDIEFEFNKIIQDEWINVEKYWIGKF